MAFSGIETIIEEPEDTPLDTQDSQNSVSSSYDDASNHFAGADLPVAEEPKDVAICITCPESISSTNTNASQYDVEEYKTGQDCTPSLEKVGEDLKILVPGMEGGDKGTDTVPLFENSCSICRYFSVIGGELYHNHVKEPWPEDVKLFQPYEVEQILLPDNANCLAVQTFLKMCNLKYNVEHRANAEAMSPTGKVPFIKCGAFVVSELDGIVQFVGSKSISLSQDLSAEDKADMRAYMTLVHNVLGNAELYICWCDTETYAEVTKPRYGSIYPWPLNHLQVWTKKSEEIKRLKVLGWQQKTLEQVYQDVETCCQALQDRLDKNPYFFGSKYTELDALVYAHLYLILTLRLPDVLSQIVRKFPTLVDFCSNINKKIMKRDNVIVMQDKSFQISHTNDCGVDDQSCATLVDEMEIEALLFGHLYTILTTPLPNTVLADTVKNFPSLIDLIKRIEKQYYQRETKH